MILFHCLITFSITPAGNKYEVLFSFCPFTGLAHSSLIGRSITFSAHTSVHEIPFFFVICFENQLLKSVFLKLSRVIAPLMFLLVSVPIRGFGSPLITPERERGFLVLSKFLKHTVGAKWWVLRLLRRINSFNLTIYFWKFVERFMSGIYPPLKPGSAPMPSFFYSTKYIVTSIMTLGNNSLI